MFNKPTIEFPSTPIYPVNSETAVMWHTVSMCDSDLNEPTGVHTQTYYPGLSNSGQSFHSDSFSIYAISGINPVPSSSSRLTESGRMWRMLAVGQAVGAFFLFLTLCVF